MPLMVLLVIVIVPMLWIPPPLMSVRLPLRMVPVIVASPTLEIAPPKSPVAMLSARVLLMVDPKKEPFTDPRVWKAIYLALDRQQIDDIVLDNTSGEPSIFMPGMAYDEREAADILREGDNHWVTLVWGRFFWQMHRDVKGFNPPQTVQYGFKHEDLWLDR